jgi:choline dehydrogenase-like flavoprotein
LSDPDATAGGKEPSVSRNVGSANPTLTIMALAARAADYLAEPASVL